MVTSQKALLALVVGFSMSAGAQAAVANQPYVGAKVGQFLVDADGLDDLTAYGVYAGYNFTPELSVEVEYMGSSEESVNMYGVNVDYDFKTYGIYGAYRYTFPNTALYAKGKLGFAKAEVNVEASRPGVRVSESNSDTGIAGGIGLGYSISPNIAIEGEYAIIEQDVDALTIGANIKF